MKAETEWIKSILPDHYTCESRENGVHCHSSIGINDDHMIGDDYNPETDDQFGLIVKAIEQKYGDRFMEIYHQTCTYHSKFTVYLRPKGETK